MKYYRRQAGLAILLGPHDDCEPWKCPPLGAREMTYCVEICFDIIIVQSF